LQILTLIEYYKFFKTINCMRSIFVAFFLFVCALSNGQFVEPKFGKIEMTDLAMTVYDRDTTASALMLFDNGNSKFFLNSELSFQFVYERHCQIKIFKKSAFDLANMSLRLYEGSKNKEVLSGLKAVTYNLIDGKIVKTKLENDKIFRAEANNYSTVSFAFPEVKEGSIIELTYAITSDYLYNFRGWNFQYSYPARWSQYSYEIPEYFLYRESSKGYLQFDVNKRETGNALFNIKMSADPGDRMTNRSTTSYETLKVPSVKAILAVANSPAFISEPNIDCEDNYKQSLEFELSSVQYPNQIRKDYTQTWGSVNSEMQDDEDFGALLKSPGFLKDTVNAICANKANSLDKAIGIYNHVRKRMKWNEEYQIWATDGLKKPYNDRSGSSSEINLILTLMLKTAGLDAKPVLFSTRDNGIANSYFPTITKFNSVLTVASIDGKTYLLDATSKYCPFGTIPANDINGKGRIVDLAQGDWINLDPGTSFKENKIYSLDINADGNMSGLITDSYDGYASIYYRNSMNSEKSIDDYMTKFQENLKGLTVSRYSINERYNIYKPLTDTLFVEITDNTEIIGNKILFSPLLFERIERNRYTLEERKYPVNFNFPISENYKFIYTIPSGYTVESIPQSVTLELPDKSVSITYSLKNIDNKIIVEYSREIKIVQILPDQYNKLKNLYDQLVKKHAEQVILKKT
jgi:hypothetical protein